MSIFKVLLWALIRRQPSTIMSTMTIIAPTINHSRKPTSIEKKHQLTIQMNMDYKINTTLFDHFIY